MSHTLTFPRPATTNPHDRLTDKTVRVDPVGTHQWRVVNTQEPSTSGRFVIGFIENTAETFDVTFLDTPGRAPESYTTLHDARTAFTG